MQLVERLIQDVKDSYGLGIDAEALRTALSIDFNTNKVPNNSTPGGRRDAAASVLGVSVQRYADDHPSDGRLSLRTAGIIEMIAVLDKAEADAALASFLLDRASPQPERHTWTPTTSVDDIQDEYHWTHAKDLDVPFWWRRSAEGYLDALVERARATPITIYAGGDGSSDIGPPLHEELLAATLIDVLRTHELFHEVALDERYRKASSIVNALHSEFPGRWLGSMLDELRRTLPGDLPDSASTLRSFMEQSIHGKRTTHGFAASAIGSLVESLRDANRPVAVLSTYFDSDLESAVPIEVEHLGGLASDRSKGPLALGEGDLLTHDTEFSDQAWPPIGQRAARLARALVESTVIFVGTSLTDPSVIAVLSLTKHHQIPRYALLLPPRLDDGEANDDGPREPLASGGDVEEVDPVITARHLAQQYLDRVLAERLLAQRYLSLGVVPITVDFPQQVGQFLRELGLAVTLGDAYKQHYSYKARATVWWEQFQGLVETDHSAAAGPPENVSASTPATATRPHREALATFESQVRAQLGVVRRHTVAEDAGFGIEFWVRNPQDRNLQLVLTTTNESPEHFELELNDDSAGSIAPRAFREGRTVSDKVSVYDEERWCVAIPIVLTGPPWYHLPVGVVTIVSGVADGTLWQASKRPDVLRKLETALDELKQLLLRRWPIAPNDGN